MVLANAWTRRLCLTLSCMRRLSSGVGVYFYKSNDFGKKEKLGGKEGEEEKEGERKLLEDRVRQAL